VIQTLSAVSKRRRNDFHRIAKQMHRGTDFTFERKRRRLRESESQFPIHRSRGQPQMTKWTARPVCSQHIFNCDVRRDTKFIRLSFKVDGQHRIRADLSSFRTSFSRGGDHSILTDCITRPRIYVRVLVAPLPRAEIIFFVLTADLIKGRAHNHGQKISEAWNYSKNHG